MALTEADQKVFLERGVLRLPGVSPKNSVSRVRESILSELARLNIWSGGRPSPSAAKIRDLPVFQQTGHLSQAIRPTPELDLLISEAVRADAHALAEARLKPSHAHPQLLISLPHKDAEPLDQLGWHLDLKLPKRDEIPGVQVFVLIDDVKPGGGATLALAGSQRLHYIEHGKNAHAILLENADFTSSPEKFLKPQPVRGIEVEIVEMSGRAGDVYLMDLRVLHSPSVNASKNVRMMATMRYLK